MHDAAEQLIAPSSMMLTVSMCSSDAKLVNKLVSSISISSAKTVPAESTRI
jgi:hypothetical protein